MSRQKLTDAEIADGLARLNAGLEVPWQLAAGKLHKGFRFPDFVAAFGFLTRAALIAERWITIPSGATSTTASRSTSARTTRAPHRAGLRAGGADGGIADGLSSGRTVSSEPAGIPPGLAPGAARRPEILS